MAEVADIRLMQNHLREQNWPHKCNGSLKNTHPEFKMPADTMGWGYQAFGYLMNPADKVPQEGKNRVTLAKYPNAEHVAVNKECCSIEYI
jgi:hypothetical protein